MKRRNHRLAVQELAASQHGYFTVAQASDRGVSRQVLKNMEVSGVTTRIIQGVYRFGSVPDNRYDMLRAIWISTAPHATTFERLNSFDGIVIGGRTAAAVQGIGDFYLSPYTFFVPKRYQSRISGTKFVRRAIAPEDVVVADGLPVTSMARTIFDLKVDSEDPSLLNQVITDAVRRPDDLDCGRLRQLFWERAQGSPKHDRDELRDMLNDAGITSIRTAGIDPCDRESGVNGSINGIVRVDGKPIPVDRKSSRQPTEPGGRSV